MLGFINFSVQGFRVWGLRFKGLGFQGRGFPEMSQEFGGFDLILGICVRAREEFFQGSFQAYFRRVWEGFKETGLHG